MAADEHAARAFVIQQHAARAMHYDFRLELRGVLLSWAVPKGPSLNPRERRLAVRVEDHRLEHAGFEGVIAPGGAVIVWDRGTWRAEDEREADDDAIAAAAMEQGKLTFDLFGEKLHGRWHLVRTRPRDKRESWLLFKAKDAAASDVVDIVKVAPASVISGRTIDEIAAAGGIELRGRR